MAKKRKEKTFSSFLNNPFDFTLLITILLLLSIFSLYLLVYDFYAIFLYYKARHIDIYERG